MNQDTSSCLWCKSWKYFNLFSINFTSAGNFVGKCENETRGNAANCLLGKLLTGYDKRLRPNFTGNFQMLSIN